VQGATERALPSPSDLRHFCPSQGSKATQGTGRQAEPGFPPAPATRTQDPEQPLRHTRANRTGRQAVALEATGGAWG